MQECPSDVLGLFCFQYDLFIVVNVSRIPISQKRKLRFGMVTELVMVDWDFRAGV